jgi:hypothetical protein
VLLAAIAVASVSMAVSCIPLSKPAAAGQI